MLPCALFCFASLLQPDQARIVGLNAQYFLKNGGHYVISIKASCIDSTAQPEAVFAREVKKLQEMQLKPREQVRQCAALPCPFVVALSLVCCETCMSGNGVRARSGARLLLQRLQTRLPAYASAAYLCILPTACVLSAAAAAAAAGHPGAI
jgi:hypothetical protein